MLRHINVATLKRHWALILAMGLLGGALAFGASQLVTPLYRATASLYFTLNFGDTANDLVQGSTYTSNQMVSFGELATSPVVLDPVIERLALDTTSEQLARSVAISTPRETVIMQVAVTASDPNRAADIANAIAEQEKTAVERFAPRGHNEKTTVNVHTIKQAVPPEFQFSPDKRQNTALGVAAGLMLGALAAIARQALDNRVRNEASLAEVGTMSFLGALRQHAARRSGQRAIVLRDATGTAAEEYRQLRSALRYATLSRRPLVAAVTSSVPGEGKTTVAVNLAAVAAEGGKRVLLIDADLRRPQVANYAGLNGLVGVSDVLVGQAPLATTIRSVGTPSFDVLCSGGVPPNPGELLASPQMTELIAYGRRHYDTVLVDTAPILAVADALELAQLCDGLVIITRKKRTRKSELKRSLEAIETAGLTVFGVVLNGVRAGRRNSGYHAGYVSTEEDTTPRYAADANSPTGARAKG